MTFKFQKLIVWQQALDINDLECILSNNFPVKEQYVLTSQLKRAADSIALNIAEGSTGQSNAEFKRFLRYALRSNIEVVACFHLAIRRGYISEQEFDQIIALCHGELILLNRLISALN